MYLELIRTKHQCHTLRARCFCLGDLWCGPEWLCNILEPYDWPHGYNVERVDWGRAIPEGEYPILVNYPSSKFGLVPLIDRVPGRTGILMHPGNTASDTRGCLLPGRYDGGFMVLRSRHYMEKVKRVLLDAHNRFEPVVLKVQNLFGYEKGMANSTGNSRPYHAILSR